MVARRPVVTSAAIADAPPGRLGFNSGPDQPPPRQEEPSAAGGEAQAMPGLDVRLVRNYRRYARLASIGAAAIGGMGLVGWIADIPLLTTPNPAWVAMKVNTAIALLAAGGGLFLAVPNGDDRSARAAGVRICAGLVAAIGFATLAEYVLGKDFGIDQLLVVEPAGAIGTMVPGRMAQVTAGNFALFGLALLAHSTRRGGFVSAPLTLLVLVYSMLALTGYLFGAEELYRFPGHFTAVAFPTAMAFLLLSTGLLLVGDEHGVLRWLASPRSGGVMLRRLLPVTVCIPLLIAWLRLQAQAAGIFSTSEFGAASVAVANVIFLSGVLLWAAAQLDRSDAARLRGEASRVAAQYAQSLIDASLDPLVTISAEGKITDVNNATEAATGVPRTQLIGSDFSDYFTEPEKARAGYRQVFSEGQVRDYALAIRHVSGRVTDVLYNASVYRDQQGHVVGVFAAARDVTDRKRAEQLTRSAALYARSLIEASLDPLVAISADGKITDVNKATEEVTGLARSGLIGTDFADYFTEPEKARAGYKQVLAIGSVTDYPLVLRHVSGKVIDVLYNASVYRDQQGGVVGVFAAARDVTDMKRAEQQTRSAALYTRSLIEASLDPLVTISPEGKITDVNRATEDATGRSRSGLIGTDFADYFTEPQKARMGYQKVLATGSAIDYPLALRHVTGRIIDVLYNASTYRDESGNVVGIFAAARDVTARKRAEQELATYRQHLEELVTSRTADLTRANELLEAANRELEAFSYSVSHDLRTPLRAIDGFSRILIEDYADKLDAEGQRVANVVRDSAQKMGRLIEDILSFSRIGRLEMTDEPIDMEALAHSITEELEPLIAGRKLTVDIKSLPAAHGDTAMMRRVWTNLLDNAIKFTKPKEPATIEVGGLTQANELIYYVKDNGVGFDMAYVGKLFGVFQRLHGVDEFPGTGIGLAIVKRIVGRHGGRVWAEGKPNEGATFYFALPAQEMKND